MKHIHSGILFDLDGTLVDTSLDFVSSLNRLLVAHGRPTQPHGFIRSTISRGSFGMVEAAFADLKDKQALETLQQEFLTYYTEHLSKQSVLFPGLGSLLAWCEEQKMPWGIVTNKSSVLTSSLLSALELSGRSRITVSGDTLTVSKPHPLPLLHACEKMGVAPEKSIYIGDAWRDIEAGNRAGMTTLVALYGYMELDDKPEEWGATALVDSPTALFDWIKGWHTRVQS